MQCEAQTAAGKQCPFHTRGRGKMCAIHQRMFSKKQKVGSPVAGRGELVHSIIPAPPAHDAVFAEEVIAAVKSGMSATSLQYMLDGWRSAV
jgi:hypothetical protein